MRRSRTYSDVWTYQDDTRVSGSIKWYNVDPLRWRPDLSDSRSNFSFQPLTYESLFNLHTGSCLIKMKLHQLSPHLPSKPLSHSSCHFTSTHAIRHGRIYPQPHFSFTSISARQSRIYPPKLPVISRKKRH